MATAYWILLCIALYSYALYPLLLMLRTALVPRKAPVREAARVSMTVITTAYNEEQRIRQKLHNLCELQYPELELLVASDCSSDATDAIVTQYQDRGVRLVRATERLGKENAQLCAIRASRSDVLVFSDVATVLPAASLQKLAQYFADPTIGAVSSEDRFISRDGQVVGEGAYVYYEMWLRRLESGTSGVVGLSGSFFAARRVVCSEWDIHSPSDFNTALNCARLGLKAVTAPDVLGYYQDLKDPGGEYERKVRTVLRGMTAIVRHRDVLDPVRFGWFAWQVWSHKVMRWVVPFALVALLLVNIPLAFRHGFFALSLVAQLLFYGCAVAAHWMPPLRRIGPVRLLYFFLQVNVAIVHAFVRLCRGRRMTTWQPSSR
ncbi:MAG: glycosyltransferase [Pseudomonadota bacterium]|nr:glycosyltransferase [Pseudomonadota bacterium]